MNAKVILVLRILLALVLIVFGANKFFNFMPAMEMPKAAGDFMMAMMATGYLLKLVGATEVVSGLLLLFNKKVPFALVILAPVVVNMIFFHLFLAPAGIGPAAVVAVITIILMRENWNKYKSLF
ncbi:MAG: DoxX family membrane protein [Lutibacter sp.]